MTEEDPVNVITLNSPQTVTRAGEVLDAMLSVTQYAAHVNAGERTVRTWLADNRLPQARKVDGKWMIPADARPVDQAPEQPAGVVDLLPAAGLPQVPQGVAALDALPVFVPVDQAAAILGVPAGAIRRNRDYFAAVQFGPRGALVVPQATIRRLAGL